MPHIAHTRYALWAVAALAAIRVAIPLAALAASGRQLPGLPQYEYDGLTGDATGFYAAAREFIASWGRLPVLIVAALAAVCVITAAVTVWAWRRRRGDRPWLVVAAVSVAVLVTCAGVSRMNAPGAAVFGWPLLWSLPMLPYRAAGLALDQDVAFVFGLVLSLAANVVTVVATAFVGLYATGRRAIGIAAAAIVAFWPLLVGIIGGERAWANGTWTIDAGLALYTEPFSTALMAVALALLLSPHLDSLRLALAGSALGLATVVKVTNGLVAAGAVALVAARLGVRRTLPLAAAGAAFVPLLLVYWPLGYPDVTERDAGAWPDEPFALDYAVSSWTDSLLFRPRTLIVLVPLAIVGAFALRPAYARRLLVLWSLMNAVVYSFYWVTPQHPRFLFASLPPVFVLWCVGAAAIVDRVRGTYTAQSPATIRR